MTEQTPDPVVHSITDATQAHSDDLDLRIKRYLISMGFRVLCVILVVVIHNPVRWVFGVFAVIMPYVAVVMANAVGHRRGKGAGPVPVSRRFIGQAPEQRVDLSADQWIVEKPAVPVASPEQSTAQSHEQTA